MLKACHYSLYVAVGYRICENTYFITFIKLHNKTVKQPSVKSVFTFYTTDQLSHWRLGHCMVLPVI